MKTASALARDRFCCFLVPAWLASLLNPLQFFSMMIVQVVEKDKDRTIHDEIVITMVTQRQLLVIIRWLQRKSSDESDNHARVPANDFASNIFPKALLFIIGFKINLHLNSRTNVMRLLYLFMTSRLEDGQWSSNTFQSPASDDFSTKSLRLEK